MSASASEQVHLFQSLLRVLALQSPELCGLSHLWSRGCGHWEVMGAQHSQKRFNQVMTRGRARWAAPSPKGPDCCLWKDCNFRRYTYFQDHKTVKVEETSEVMHPAPRPSVVCGRWAVLGARRMFPIPWLFVNSLFQKESNHILCTDSPRGCTRE